MDKTATFEIAFNQLQAALQERLDVGVRYEGVATHLIDIRNFHVVPLKIYKLLYVLESPGSIMTNYSQYSRVIYFSPQLNRHVRGTIILVYPDRSCDVYAIDYGVTDAGVKRDQIFNLLHPKAEVVPGVGQLCELAMCYPREGPNFSREAQESFKFFMGQRHEALMITVKEVNNQKLSVFVMSSNSNPDDVSTSLAHCNHTRFFAGPI